MALDTVPGLEHRWQGIFAYPPMRVLSDALSDAPLGLAVPTNDYTNIDTSLLPFLAWQLQALAFDPGGTEEQQRESLRQARRLHTLIGTQAAFDLLMEIFQTQGELILCGDYDSAGQPVARAAADPLIPRGTHSRHSADPMQEDTTRDAQGRPTSTPNPSFVWDNYVYHKQCRIVIVLPPGRRDDETFVSTVIAAAQRVLPYTLEVVHVTVLVPFDAAVHLHSRYYTYRQQWILPDGSIV